MKQRIVPRTVQRFSFLLMIAVLLLQPVVLATPLTKQDRDSFNNDTIWYDTRDTSGSSCAGTTDTTVVSTLPEAVPEPHRTLFTNAAAAYHTSPQLVAALFLSENSNEWRPFDYAWKTSPAPALAAGPFQFRPGTWSAHKVDGDHSGGEPNINNMVDAAFSAANLLSSYGVTETTPLGTLDKPFTPGTMLFAAAAYNWGGGNVQQHTNPNSVLTVVPLETQNYLQNIFALVSSGFTKGRASDPKIVAGTPSPAPVTQDAGAPTTVVLDPGHAGANTVETDPGSGVISAESGGAPGEMQNMWDTAQLIKSKLETDGYKVVLTKNSENDTAGLVTKAGRANQSGGAIAVSLHYTGGVNFGTTNQHWGVTPQEVGRFRQNKIDGKRKSFDDATLAQKSLQYAQTIAQERTKVGDNANVAPLDQSFPKDRPDVQAWGDISIVQLLGKIPWVYNEVGATNFDKQKYADGITNGIEKAVPKTGAATTATSDCSNGAVAGNIVQTAINYAWEDGRDTPEQKPTYRTAVAAALQKHLYVGGGVPIGDDCGGFITRVMQDSGADPNYGTGSKTAATQGQEAYLVNHPDKYLELHPNSTADLQPGDIAISNSGKEHTYMYVGKQEGFATTIASASIPDRAPTAGKETPADKTYRWFRFIR